MVTEEQYRTSLIRLSMLREIKSAYNKHFMHADGCLKKGTLTNNEHLAVCRGLKLAEHEVDDKMSVERSLIELYEIERREERALLMEKEKVER